MAVALSAGKPKSITALHTLQGMTAQPGLKAHWLFPPNLPSKTEPPMSCFLDRGWTIFCAVAPPKAPETVQQFRQSMWSMCMLLSFLLMNWDLMKSCFAIAWWEIWWNHVFAKLRSNVHQDCGTEDLQHAQIKKGRLFDISLLLGLYAGLNIDALHLYFSLDRWAGHWFVGSQHLVMRYLSTSLCFNLFWFNVWWTQNVTPNKFHQPSFFCNLFVVTSILQSTDGASKEKGGPWAPKKKIFSFFLFYEKWRWVPRVVRYKFFAWWREGVWNASKVGSLDDLFFVVFGSLGLRDLPFMLEDQCINFWWYMLWCMLDPSFYFQ